MRLLTAVLVCLPLVLTLAAQKKEFDVPGPIELHIYLTAKAGQEAELERVYKEVFYPAVSRQKGFRSSQLMRKPNTSEYTVRLSFNTEELRMQWVASADHQKAWPALQATAAKANYAGFGVIHPVK
jgi:heme-degrading monooxygenase HmoA